MFEVITETPLHSFLQGTAQATDPTRDGLVIQELGLSSYLNLRGDPIDESFLASVEAVLGVPVPTKPNSFCSSAENSVFWMGPNEWLVRSSEDASSVEKKLRDQLTGHFSVVDVSGGYTTLTLAGEGALWVMKKSCVYDVETIAVAAIGANANREGKSVQTVFAKAGAIISRPGSHEFQLTIRRSFSDYIARWLEDASAEFGGRFRTSDAGNEQPR
ncbi:MAG: sarcosine oxidase subunit gamma [Pseudomonadales bacterium]